MAKNLVMGATDTGKSWCIKALHPSDPLTEVRGIPDKSAVPSVFLNYQSTFTLSPPGTGFPTWQFDSALVPHPITFMSVAKAYTNLSSASAVALSNQQITGATHTAKYQTFKTMCERWRLAYMSVTVYQDAPSLSDQGTIVVCQLPIQPKHSATGFSLAPYSTPPGSNWAYLCPITEGFTDSDLPSFERSQAMPNAYFSRSKEGAYVPLKLTKTCQKWHSQSDSVLSALDNSTTAVLGASPLATYFKSASATFPPIVADLAAYNAAVGGVYPHFDLHPVMMVASLTDGIITAPNVFLGDATSAMCNDNWAHISARNLSTSTSYSFFIRAGFEVQVQPGSVLSPDLKISPMYDEDALKSYFMISREMKDAYPADYNDLGKIWNVIKGVASTVAPYISKIPGPIGAITRGYQAMVPGFKKLYAQHNPEAASAADLEHAKAEIAAASQPSTSTATVAQPPRQRRKRKPRGNAKMRSLAKYV